MDHCAKSAVTRRKSHHVAATFVRFGSADVLVRTHGSASEGFEVASAIGFGIDTLLFLLNKSFLGSFMTDRASLVGFVSLVVHI